MRGLILILFLVTPFVLPAQDTVRSGQKFSVGITASSDYSNISYISDGSSVGDTLARLMTESLRPKPSFTIGVNCLFDPIKRVGFDLGLLVANRGMMDVFEWKEYISPDSSMFMKIKNIYTRYYLDMPVKVRINILTSPFRFFVSAGVSANFQFQERTKSFIEYEDGTEKVFTDRSPVTFTNVDVQVLGSAGIEYFIKDMFRVRFEPVFRHSVITPRKHPVKSYLWSFGGILGFYYIF